MKQESLNPEETNHQFTHDFFMEKENRKIITPYAFSVKPELLGWPLATPIQRLIAISIDLLLVYMALLLLPKPLQFMLASIILWKLSSSKHIRLFSSRRLNQDAKKIKLAAIIITLLSIPEFQHLSWNWIDENRYIIEVNITESISFFSLAMMYFVLLPLIWNGKTIGKQLMGIQIIKLDQKSLSVWELTERYGGYIAGITTGMMGFAQIYWDYNRQTIQDKVAHTLVIKSKNTLKKP